MDTAITTTITTTTVTATTTTNTVVAETVDITVTTTDNEQKLEEPKLIPEPRERKIIETTSKEANLTASENYQGMQSMLLIHVSNFQLTQCLVSGEALKLPSMDISGQSQATHLRIPAITFVKSFLVDEGSSDPDLGEISRNVIANPVYRESREAYFTACQALPSDDIEFNLINFLNCIIELAPKCGLNAPDALHVHYMAEPPDPDEEYGVPYCGVYLRNHPPEEGGRAIMALDVQRPDYIFKPRIYSDPEDQPPRDKRSRSPSESLIPPPKRSRHNNDKTSVQSSVSSKPPSNHSRASTDRGNTSHEPVPVPHDMPDPTQLVRSAFDIMVKLGARRRHVFGILVKGMDVYLSYYDRVGSVFTERLDLVDDEALLVHILILLAICSPVQLGMEPGIHPSSASMIAAMSPDARGCTIDVEGRRFVIDDLIHKAGSEFGRGTTVFKAHPDHTESESVFLENHVDALVTLPDTVVVKLSWQDTSQDSEDSFFRRAAKYDIKGIAKLYLSTVLGKLSAGGRGKALKPFAYIDRELRVQVMGPLCKPLYSVSNLDFFKTAYISLVEGLSSSQLFCFATKL